MILRGNETIEDLRFRPTAMVKNFKPNIWKRFRGISKVIFIYDLKQLAKAERERDAIEGEKIDIVVRWGLNLAATRIFGTVKHWPSTSMWGVHAEEPRDEERPANGLRCEGKMALKRHYIGSVHKFHRWLYKGGGRAGTTLKLRRQSCMSLPAPASPVRLLRQTKSSRFLKALWQNEVVPQTLFCIEPAENDERNLVINRLWRIFCEGDDNMRLGYDQIMYRTLRQCDKMSLIMWLIHTFLVD